MADLITEINRRFKEGSILTKYIFINIGVFISLILVINIFKLFNITEPSILEHVGVPSSPETLLYRPWTIITYMFVHLEFFHIFINMLWLYWFGKIFLTFFTGRQLGGLYIIGGIAGALLFLLSYNTFPYFRESSAESSLIGASASVMAIVFAISFYQKEYSINLLLIGRIKLIYLAIGVLLLDIMAITSTNAGGHIAHIGGALLGILYASLYNKGKDITGFINKAIDRVVNMTKRKPVFKVYSQDTSKSHKVETDDEYLQRKKKENAAIDEILDKLKRSGYESLSAADKKKLFDASRK